GAGGSTDGPIGAGFAGAVGVGVSSGRSPRATCSFFQFSRRSCSAASNSFMGACHYGCGNSILKLYKTVAENPWLRGPDGVTLKIPAWSIPAAPEPAGGDLMNVHGCRGVTRRTFLADTGMGLTGLALGSLLRAEERRDHPDGMPHHRPRAKSVIWLFMCGGVSHVESFDVKPELNKYAGKTIEQTPYKDAFDLKKLNIVGANPAHGNRKQLMGLNTSFKKYGQCGLAVGDWFKHVGECADDLAVIRSLWTTDNDHGAQLQFHTGRHVREGALPTVGSWACYGLGALNQNLPEYCVLGVPTGDCCGGEWTHGAA